MFAHRASWIARNGPIPVGLLVLHECDVRNCINPDHLRVGTHEDNAADMVKRGRKKGMGNWKRGETVATSKLSRDQVIEILLDTTRTQRDIASCYGVSEATVSLIKNGKLWRHVTDPLSVPYRDSADLEGILRPRTFLDVAAAEAIRSKPKYRHSFATRQKIRERAIARFAESDGYTKAVAAMAHARNTKIVRDRLAKDAVGSALLADFQA